MRGIILAGGKGTRLRPATYAMNKHMVPILETPMILYPLATLKLLGCTDILIVSGGNHIGAFAEFLGDGTDRGVSLTYRVQSEAGGIAQALGLAREFAGGQGVERVAVVLGDNVFDNEEIAGFRQVVENEDPDSAHLFIKEVPNANRFGVLVHDGGDKYKILEKPEVVPEGAKAVTGLYIYPQNVFDIVKKLKPSARGELEITDVNNWYIENEQCLATELHGFWSDAGTPESLYEVTKWAYERRSK